MNVIAVIGAGGIGFRHTQALLNIALDTALYVVDISDDALVRVRDYAAQTEQNPHIKELHTLHDLSELPGTVDLAVIATTSGIRRKLTERLLHEKKVRFLLLEKVLFPRLEDYDAVGALLKETGTAAYVNCGRRAYPSYQALRRQILTEGKAHFTLTGSNWGLACNAIHEIDLFAYLTGADCKSFRCDGTLLDNTLLESKRGGYLEFSGILSGSFDRGSFFIQCDQRDTEPASSILQIRTDRSCYLIDEDRGIIEVSPLSGGALEQRPFECLYISQITNHIAEELLTKEVAVSPSFEDSAALHRAMLKAFLDKQAEITGEESDTCSIT